MRVPARADKMFGNTQNFTIDSPINSMAVSRDGAHIAVAGRSLLKVYSLSNNEQSFCSEHYNLRSSNLKNLNFSNNDVTWCPLDDNILATAATNGAVVVWNIAHSVKSKIQTVFNDHKRTVNKVCFHYSDPNLLLSGSQDGCMKLFDLRRKEASTTFVSNSESVRDVQFSPTAYSGNHFASVQETGNVEIWDIRRTDKPEHNFIAHDGPVFACEWHPNQEQYKWLATGGRDKTIKVWDLNNRVKPTVAYSVHTIAPVSKLKWRPNKDFHIGNCSLVVDFSVYVWDIKRPYVPYAIFATRKDVTTGFAWKNDPNVFISSCKDGTIYQHRFETDAYYPAESYPPTGIDFSPSGDLAYSLTDFIHRYSKSLNNSSTLASTNMNGTACDYQASSRLIKTHSLGTNSIITPTGIMAAIPNAAHQQHAHQNQPQSYAALSSSLNQNSWEPVSISNSVTDMKSRLNQYLPSQFQYQHSLQSNVIFQGHQQPNSGTPLHNSINSSQGLYPPYNISVPISYTKTNEAVLNEHFRCMVSYMMFFLSKEAQDPSLGLAQNALFVKHFVESAKRYYLSDRPFEELCELNAQIADSLEQHQIAQTWRIVRHMFSIPGRHPTSSGGGAGNNPSGGSLPNMPINEIQGVDFKMKTDNPSRHTSGGTRHFSGNNPAANNQLSNLSNAGNLINPTGQTYMLKNSDDEEDGDAIDGVAPLHHFDSLKGLSQGTMPSNKFATDFFAVDTQNNMDGEDIFARQFDNRMENPYNEYDNNQDWELQRESIMHKHNIVECAIPPDFNSQNLPEPPNYDVSSPVSFDEDEDLAETGQVIGIFDTNVQTLLITKPPPMPNWPFTEIVSNMLYHYVDNGDVQTAISIILVLGEKVKLVTDINSKTIKIWYRSYIDLLHRFQLWNVACRLIQLSADSDIHAINQTSTTILVFCAKCNRAIKAGTVCEKCSLEPANCAICHVSVRGLYTWCQGCSHGGHMQHMLDWFKENSMCPAGCGHRCEFC